MFDDLGAALCGVLRGALPAGVDLRLEPPNSEWQQADQGPAGTLSLFLYRVVPSRTTDSGSVWTENRGPDGRVVSRTSAELRYDCCFLTTAWAGDPAAELALLGSVLRAVANTPMIEPARLTGSLAAARGPVMLALGNPDLPATPPEIWRSLGLAARSSLDLVVTAPVVTTEQTGLARPPETIDLGVTGTPNPVDPDGTGARALAPGLRPDGAPSSRRPVARITEGPRRG
jgi:hypothetical protein